MTPYSRITKAKKDWGMVLSHQAQGPEFKPFTISSLKKKPTWYAAPSRSAEQ
jgi:hypothetical protein